MIKADTNRQRSVPGSEGLPREVMNRAAREYLTVLHEAAFGGATEVVPKFISIADPASRWTGANGGLAFFVYSTNYLIDLKCAVIMDVEATASVRQAEVTAQRTMIDRTQERLASGPRGLPPTPAMARPRISRGWFMNAASSRTSRCSTNPHAATAPLPVRISSLTKSATDISAPAARI